MFYEQNQKQTQKTKKKERKNCDYIVVTVNEFHVERAQPYAYMYYKRTQKFSPWVPSHAFLSGQVENMDYKFTTQYLTTEVHINWQILLDQFLR